MADNFNLRTFLTENKLTKNAQLLKENQEDYKYFDEEGIGGFYLGQVKGITIYSLEDSSVMDTCMYALEGPQGVEFIDIDVAGEPISSEELQNEYELQSDIADFIEADIAKELGDELDETFVPKSDAEYKAELEDYLQNNQIYGYTDMLFDILTSPQEESVADTLADFLDDHQIYGYNKGLLAIFRDYSNRNSPDNEDNLDEADWRNNPFTPHNFDGVARQAQQSKELQAVANRMFPEFGGKLKDLGAPLTPDQRNAVWATWSKEKTQRERSQVDDEEQANDIEQAQHDMERRIDAQVENTLQENRLTAKERRLVEMVNSAMREEEEGNTFYRRGGDDEIPNPPAELHIPKELTSEDEMADETVIPEYNTIDELMDSIDHGTNEVAEKHKMQEMKKIAQMLREKAKKMEESEHAAHISPKDLKQLATDAAKLEKAAEKLKAAFDKKFNKKDKPAAAPKAEKVEALQEGAFDLRKFLIENRK